MEALRLLMLKITIHFDVKNYLALRTFPIAGLWDHQHHHHCAALHGVPGQRVASSPPTCCCNTKSHSQGRCQRDTVYCGLVATSLGPSCLSYRTPNQPPGPCDLALADAGAAVDYPVRAEHLHARLQQTCGPQPRTKGAAAHGIAPAGGLHTVGLCAPDIPSSTR